LLAKLALKKPFWARAKVVLKLLSIENVKALRALDWESWAFLEVI